MGIEEKRKFIINVLYYVILAVLAYFAVKYAYPLLSPFLIGLFIAFVLRKPIAFVSQKLHLRRGISAIFVTALMYATIGSLVSLVIVRLVVLAKDVFWELPRIYRSEVEPSLRALIVWLDKTALPLAPAFNTAVHDIFTQLIDALGNLVSSFSVRVVSVATNYLSSIPGFLLRIVLTIIASFFFAADYLRVREFIRTHLPQKSLAILTDVKQYLSGTLFKLARSYFFIMCITYTEVTIGLGLLGIKGFAWIAALIAILDIFPIFGTGTVLIPWAVVSFLQGEIGRGIGLVVLYAVVFIVRQAVEPRIVGHQVGLHPVVILVSMFVGVQVFGALGLFGLPVLVALIHHLYKSGKLPWKPKREKNLEV